MFFPIDCVSFKFSYLVGSPLRYEVPVRVLSLYTDAYSHELLLFLLIYVALRFSLECIVAKVDE